MTFSIGVDSWNASEVRYRGFRLTATKRVAEEMERVCLSLTKCKDILIDGYDAPRKRGSAVEERWFDKGTKTYNVVVARTFNHFCNEELYVIIHVGMFTKHEGGNV